MNKIYRRWACGFLAALLALLSLCAGVVYTVDPCLYYRIPARWQPVFFNERYQSAGMIRNVPADTVILGTSMAANYRASRAEAVFGGRALRITIPDGYYSEFDQAVDLIFRTGRPRRVIFGLDLNVLIRDESGLTGAMPDYLYDQNPLNDVKYLLNKDSLYYCFYTLMTSRQGGGRTLDEGFTWDKESAWGRYETLRTYRRPDPVETALPAGSYLDNVDGNLAVLGSWLREHPDTEFHLFLPPYSILYWDRAIRKGELEARFAALERACRTLLSYDNARLYGFLFDGETVTDLNHYCDYIHHSEEVCAGVLSYIAAGKSLLTAENLEEALAQWREFVINYDYESIWDQDFWDQWNATHDAPPVWYEG